MLLPIILGDAFGEHMLLNFTTMGFAVLEILLPKGKHFHHGSEKKVLMNTDSWLLHVTLVSSSQVMTRKGGGGSNLSGSCT